MTAMFDGITWLGWVCLIGAAALLVIVIGLLRDDIENHNDIKALKTEMKRLTDAEQYGQHAKERR